MKTWATNSSPWSCEVTTDALHRETLPRMWTLAPWVRGMFITHCDDISQPFAAAASVNKREPSHA
jgi:hypothetical protein